MTVSSYSICCSIRFVFFCLSTFSAMALLMPLSDDVHRLYRHARWIHHHRLELDLEIQALQSLYTLNAPGHREILKMWHDASHDAVDSGRFPDYGGKGSCVALIASFSGSGLGKGRASYYMETFWGKVLCHDQDQHLRDLAWWTLRWAADFNRSLVWIFPSCIFILFSYGL